MKRLLVIVVLSILTLVVVTPVSAGISPGKVEVENYQNGIEVESYITVFNNTDVTQSYVVSFKIPDNTISREYQKATAEAANWVHISNEHPTVEAHSSLHIPIKFKAPYNAKTPRKWEFQISVIADGQGNIQIEECSRWLITEPYNWNMGFFYVLVGFLIAVVVFIIGILYKQDLVKAYNRIKRK